MPPSVFTNQSSLSPGETERDYARTLLEAMEAGAALRIAAVPARPSGFYESGGEADAPAPPESVAGLLHRLLTLIARGEDVHLFGEEKTLTTQQAADLLGMSRPHLTRLLKEGIIPHHMVGEHHRVKLGDVLAYRNERSRRGKILDDLAAESQKLGLYEQ
jgi:excisionase family DNA binding protein